MRYSQVLQNTLNWFGVAGPSPLTQRAWEQCFMLIDKDKHKYRLFIAAKSQRFLLSAWTDSKRCACRLFIQTPPLSLPLSLSLSLIYAEYQPLKLISLLFLLRCVLDAAKFSTSPSTRISPTRPKTNMSADISRHASLPARLGPRGLFCLYYQISIRTKLNWVNVPAI